MNRRRFVFLQGPATPFFKKLDDKLRNYGHQTWKVNFCGGDKLISLGMNTLDFRGASHEMHAWFKTQCEKYHFTDMVLFGDAREIHQVCMEVAKAKNITIHVYEEGYLRPDWITLEQNGVNANSHLFNKPASWYKKSPIKRKKEITAEQTNNKLHIRLWHDFYYRLGNFLLSPMFPYYKRHRPHNAAIEYLGWAIRYSKMLITDSIDKKRINTFFNKKIPYFFFPLQLDSDSQIKHHSNFKTMENAIIYVLQSFAIHAHKNHTLIIKNHPLDTGLINYRKIIYNTAAKLNISADRILYVESGHLPNLLDKAQGTVVINSTVGLSALWHKSPTCVIGKSLYNIDGLTNKTSLNDFWKNPVAPDPEFFLKVKNIIAIRTQVNGNFYTDYGIHMAINGSLKKLKVSKVPTLSQVSDFYADLPILPII